MTLKERLEKVAYWGALSTQDLATWLDLPYPTVRSYRQGVLPNAARRPQIEQRLQWLETAIKTDEALPVPLSVRATQRKSYILRVFNRVRRHR